jgi:hypothetical protein
VHELHHTLGAFPQKRGVDQLLGLAHRLTLPEHVRRGTPTLFIGSVRQLSRGRRVHTLMAYGAAFTTS